MRSVDDRDLWAHGVACRFGQGGWWLQPHKDLVSSILLGAPRFVGCQRHPDWNLVLRSKDRPCHMIMGPNVAICRCSRFRGPGGGVPLGAGGWWLQPHKDLVS